MVRRIVKPTDNNFILQLPDELVGKTVEVIAFEINDAETNPSKEKNVSFTVLHVNGDDYKFDRDEANER